MTSTNATATLIPTERQNTQGGAECRAVERGISVRRPQMIWRDSLGYLIAEEGRMQRTDVVWIARVSCPNP